jgi:2-polyprenyl-3-methyl-5-hydroxy-6-metoxy-1,4-benzoquinol methylase
MHAGPSWRCPGCGHAPAVEGDIPMLAPALARGTGEDAEYQHDELAEAETRHFWFVARKQLIAETVQRHFPSAGSMLDVGCGTGGVADFVRAARPSMTVAGGDVLINGLKIAKRLRPAVEFVQFDIRDLPYDSEFDVLGAFDVIEHLDDDAGVLAQMRQATKPGGGVVITVPQHQWLWSPIDEFSRHRRRYSRQLLISTLEKAGFRVEFVTSFMTFLLPALILSRLNRQPAETLDPNRELRVAPAVNAVMGRICGLERAAIRAGVSFPAGGSLLAVGRRAN